MALIGFGMVVTFMVLIMMRKLSAFTALIVIPILFGLMTESRGDLGGMIMEGMVEVAPIAIMLIFAILFFALMYDAGLFDPLVKRIIRLSGDDPLRIAIYTTVLGVITSLDGDGTSTVLIVVTAMLPLYLKVGMNPCIIAVLLLLTNTVINVVPWGGPTARAASALNLDATEVFMGLIPAILIAVVYAFFVAYWLGLRERKRLNWTHPNSLSKDIGELEYHQDGNPARRPRLFWLNLALTIGLFGSMALGFAPLPALMVGALALALVINYPNLSDQKDRLMSHSGNVLTVATLILGAGVFAGIINGTGMVSAMSEEFVAIIPDGAGEYFSVIVAFISLPLTFILSNDAFFFGVVPIMGGVGSEFNIDAMNIARASLMGMPVHALSPLIAPIYLISSMLKVEVGDLQRYALPWAVSSSFIFIIGGVITGAII